MNHAALTQPRWLISRRVIARLGMIAATVGAALLATPQAYALAVGDQVSGQLEVGAKQVPLPSGTWVVGGIGTQPFRMPEIGAFGSIQSVVLLQQRNDTVQAVVEINANTMQVNDGWGRTKGCAADKQQLLVITRYVTGWETSCQFIRATRFNGNTPGPQAWEQARAYAAKAKVALPSMWLTAGFRVSDRQDILDVRFHVNPTLLLGPAAARLDQPGDWEAGPVAADPLRQGAVQALTAWATGFDAWVERGLRNRISAPAGPLPEPGTPIVSYADAKVGELRRLYDQGLITREAFTAQSKEAQSEVPEFVPNTSVLSNSVKKNLSFRSFGTFVDYGIAYVVTASNTVSWGIALTLNASDSVWFVLNDQYWDNHYAKQNTHNSERIVDFQYIGEEGTV